MTINQGRVLVTGASGYIALHCILELLNNGYEVKGSLRDLNREDEVRKSLGNEFNNNNLEFCKLNLLNDVRQVKKHTNTLLLEFIIVN